VIQLFGRFCADANRVRFTDLIWLDHSRDLPSFSSFVDETGPSVFDGNEPEGLAGLIDTFTAFRVLTILLG
jgi:hypothetical protein